MSWGDVTYAREWGTLSTGMLESDDCREAIDAFKQVVNMEQGKGEWYVRGVGSWDAESLAVGNEEGAKEKGSMATAFPPPFLHARFSHGEAET